jgi:RimJ/RimL family protein N-acetyltransferase
VLTPTSLATERLTLTPLTVEDADAMVNVLGDERMYEFTGGRPRTLEELRKHYGWLAAGRSADGSELWFNWIVRFAGAPDPVGVVQATVAPDGSTADVAWEVGVPWQGRGIAVEAAQAMVGWLLANGVGRVRATVHPDHVASSRVAERVGLERTADVEDGEVVWCTPAP